MSNPDGYMLNGKMYPAPFAFTENAVMEYILELEAENELLREDCKFLLSFAPKDVVPELDPTFYSTLSYGGDLQLQQRIDGIKAALEENNDE